MLTIELNATAKHLDLPPERLLAKTLTISAPFQIRRKGVETKLILGNTPSEIDLTLIRNIAKAMEWYEAVKSGKSFAQIATQAGVKTDRVRSVIGLAFLAPDIIDRVVTGTLPRHMTSDYLIKIGVPSEWNAQRKILAKTDDRAARR